MKKYLCFLLTIIIATSCESSLLLFSDSQNVIKNISFEGALYAKNTINVKFRAKAGYNCNFRWFIADSPTSDEWKILPGIHTPEIVLLTDYANKYLKCEIAALKNGEKISTAEIISKEPIVDRGNPNADWLRDAGLGVMVHFLKALYAKDGGSKEWNEVVDGFDVDFFASQCKEAGVKYVLWALGQNDGYYNAPNAAYDKITFANNLIMRGGDYAAEEIYRQSSYGR